MCVCVSGYMCGSVSVYVCVCLCFWVSVYVSICLYMCCGAAAFSLEATEKSRACRHSCIPLPKPGGSGASPAFRSDFPSASTALMDIGQQMWEEEQSGEYLSLLCWERGGIVLRRGKHFSFRLCSFPVVVMGIFNSLGWWECLVT